MTTYDFEEVSCAACGHRQQVQTLVSTNAFGSMDLDTRPPEMARTAQLTAIATCDSCGYSAPDLEELPEGVTSADLTPLLERSNTSSLQDRWSSWSRINAAFGMHSEAGWAALRAAWACDDAGLDARAVEYRLKAAEQFELARQDGQAFAADRFSERLLRADVLRRARAFDAALEEVQDVPTSTPDMLAKLMLFERTLAAREDAGTYTVADALDIATESPD